VFADEPSDNQERSYHIRNNTLGRPERHFQAEEAVFPFKTDFAVCPVQGRTVLLTYEIIGFTIPGKMNGMSLVLQVMTEMEAPGCVPESLTADNKKDLHDKTCIKEYVPVNNEMSGNFLCSSRGSFCIICLFFRDEDPCQNIDNDACSDRENCHYRPDKPDHRGVNIKVFTKTSTDSSQDPFFF